MRASASASCWPPAASIAPWSDRVCAGSRYTNQLIEEIETRDLCPAWKRAGLLRQQGGSVTIPAPASLNHTADSGVANTAWLRPPMMAVHCFRIVFSTGRAREPCISVCSVRGSGNQFLVSCLTKGVHPRRAPQNCPACIFPVIIRAPLISPAGVAVLDKEDASQVAAPVVAVRNARGEVAKLLSPNPKGDLTRVPPPRGPAFLASRVPPNREN